MYDPNFSKRSVNRHLLWAISSRNREDLKTLAGLKYCKSLWASNCSKSAIIKLEEERFFCFKE